MGKGGSPRGRELDREAVIHALERLMPTFQCAWGKISMDELRRLKWDPHRCAWAWREGCQGGGASRWREGELPGGGRAAREPPPHTHRCALKLTEPPRVSQGELWC